MKRLASVLLVVALLCSLFANSFFVAKAETYTSGYYTYKILDDDTAELSYNYKIEQTEEVINIPSKIDGFTVTSLNCPFYWAKNATTLNIPSTVNNIDMIMGDLYYAAPKLNEINVSDDNKYFCSKNGVLYSKDLTKLIKYPTGRQNTEFSVPDSVKVIGEHAFRTCHYLEKVIIPNSVDSINKRAFQSCDFEKIIIPKNVNTIDMWAFQDCHYLKQVTVLNPSAYIGEWAFGFSQSGSTNVLISGYPGSTAEKYVDEYSTKYADYTIIFSPINEIPNGIHIYSDYR